MLHSIKHNNASKMWCGPAAIAAVTGVDTKTITQIIRSVGNKSRVKGVSNDDLLRALKVLGYETTLVDKAAFRWERETLCRWKKKNKAKLKTPVIVNVTGHYVVLHGDMFVDNHTKTPVRFSKAPHRRKLVKYAWSVKKVGKSTWVPAGFLPTDERSAKRQAMLLANKYDISIDGSDFAEMEMIYVDGPDCLCDSEELDPYYDNHICRDWHEALEHVRGYIQVISKRNNGDIS